MEKSERIQIRLNKESKEFLEKLAGSEDRSLSQTAGRMIDSHVELLKKMGQSFYNEYVRLVKSHKAEEIAKAFEYLSQCDECIDEQIEIRQLKRKVKK